MQSYWLRIYGIEKNLWNRKDLHNKYIYTKLALFGTCTWQIWLFLNPLLGKLWVFSQDFQLLPY